MAQGVVMQCPALPQRNPNHGALGLIGSFANGRRHFASLAAAKTDAAFAVAHDDQRRKAETRPPFTTLATRLTLTSRSTSSRPPSSERSPRPRAPCGLPS